MRVLLLFRGAPGCGKSTYIEDNGLKPYTLCADDIRLMCASPTMDISGFCRISPENDNLVWKTLFQILETRMQHGEFTVIDASNSKTEEMKRYKDLADQYRYRIYCIDMTDAPRETLLQRNCARPLLKQVPEEVIDKMLSRFETQKVPAGIQILKPDELHKIWYRPAVLSDWKKIHVIGDIHGCNTALQQYLAEDGGLHPDELYIFTGDYVDRGIENAETVNFLLTQTGHKNMIFLEGNHERWLWKYANDEIADSREFEFVTKPQLDKAGVSKKAIREFYRRLCQCVYFTYYGKTFLITHGGLANMPVELTTVATDQLIRGTGRYSEANLADESFCKHTNGYAIQIHGHRNVEKSPIQTTECTYNLEGDVERGGYLRAVQITKESITTVAVKNEVFQTQEEKEAEDNARLPGENVDMTTYQMVHEMRGSRNVKENRYGRVSSFNFTRQAFYDKAWDSITTKARGLFIDNETYEIVARSYDKFFAINERPETQLSSLRYKLHFPVKAYVKENGFLGIVGRNPETNDLLICSKSTPRGPFADIFRENLYRQYGEETMNRIKDYILQNNVSFVFECCDMEKDPHIIEYPKSKVVLLDVIKNQPNFEKLPYEDLLNLAEDFGLSVKYLAYIIDSWEDFVPWFNKMMEENYTFGGEYIEGFVLEDAHGFMTKMKLAYYRKWKNLRSVAVSTLKTGSFKYTGSLLTPMENAFYGWCKHLYETMPPADRMSLADQTHTNICTLRKQFLSTYKETP